MQNPRPSRRRKAVFTGFGVFLLFVLVFVVFFSFNFKTVEVKGASMEPTFHNGQRLLVSSAYWLVGSLKRNDIVVVQNQNNEFIIKRVYAVGGDTVDWYNAPENWSLVNGEYVVPQNQFYLLGDNRPLSEDSREFGPVPANEIIGKVIVVGFGKPPELTAQAK